MGTASTAGGEPGALDLSRDGLRRTGRTRLSGAQPVDLLQRRPPEVVNQDTGGSRPRGFNSAEFLPDHAADPLVDGPHRPAQPRVTCLGRADPPGDVSPVDPIEGHRTDGNAERTRSSLRPDSPSTGDPVKVQIVDADDTDGPDPTRPRYRRAGHGPDCRSPCCSCRWWRCLRNSCR